MPQTNSDSSSSRIRVTHVISSIAKASGGPSESVSGLCQELGRSGAAVNLCTLDYGELLGPSVKIDPALVQLQAVPVSGRLGRFVHPKTFTQALESLVRESDVVHTHGLWESVIPCATMLARKFHKPLIMSVRGMLDPPSLRHSLWKKRLAMLFYMRSSLRSAQCYHATADMEARHLREFGLKGPIAVIPNGMTTWPYLKRDRRDSRRWLAEFQPHLAGKKVMLFLSRIHPQKGTVMLLEAWASLCREFPDWHLLLAGPDCNGHVAQLQAQAQRLGCADRITFLGEIYGGRKTSLYVASDLFVLPSFSENFGRVIIEALAAGVPVITTTATPWQELEQHRCGLWVEGAPGPIAEAMRRGMSMTEQERREAGHRGKDLIVSKYDWTSIAASTISVYNWLRSGGAPPPCVYLDDNIPAGGRPGPGPHGSPATASAGRIHVTHVISTMAHAGGGPPQVAKGLCEATAHRGHDVTICTVDLGSLSGLSDVEAYSCVDIRSVPGVARFGNVMVPPGFREMLAQSVSQSHVVHVHGLWDMLIPCATRAARKAGKPCVMTVHGMLDPHSLRHSRWRKRIAMWVYMGRSMAEVGCLHATSEVEVKNIRLARMPHPVALIPNGVDADSYLFTDRTAARTWTQQTWPELKGKRVLLFLSRLHAQKGTVPLVEAWGAVCRDHPDWHLVMAGPDCLGHRAELEGMLHREGLSGRVSLVGGVEKAAKSRLYAASDLFVLPSPSESFGIVVAEALASGVPAIATTGAPWEDLPEQGCGWWVEPGAASLVPAIREAMALSDRDRARMGRCGRELVASKYSWTVVAGQMLELYTWMISGGPPPAFVRMD